MMSASVCDVLKRYAEAYIEQFGSCMTAQQKKVLRAVEACRELSLGTIRYRCVSCGIDKNVPRSCCNRHCPKCQWKTQQQWLAREQRLLLPCPYFMVTFTLPKDLRDVAMRFPKSVYPALMTAAAHALKTAAKNPRFVGAERTGFLGVLHTWGRDLSFHPHAHFLAPAGGIDAAGDWTPSRTSVFVPAQVLEKLFRGKLKSLLEKAGVLEEIPPSVWNGRFVVDSKPVGSGEHALKYLAPYVMRGCVANWRVTECNGAAELADATLTLQVKRSGTNQYKPMPLTVTEFIRRWLQHVVPCGMHRVRRYGLLHPASKLELEELRLLIAVALGRLHYLLCTEQVVTAELPKMRCECCGGAMVSLGYFPPTSDSANEDSSPKQTRAPP